MERHDYRREMAEDIRQYIEDNEINVNDEEFDVDELRESLWTEDSVTGNGSGSYTFNRWRAEENLCHNLDLLDEALAEFGGKEDTEWLTNPEMADVTIRCYLLDEVVAEVVEGLQD